MLLPGQPKRRVEVGLVTSEGLRQTELVGWPTGTHSCQATILSCLHGMAFHGTRETQHRPTPRLRHPEASLASSSCLIQAPSWVVGLAGRRSGQLQVWPWKLELEGVGGAGVLRAPARPDPEPMCAHPHESEDMDGLLQAS